MSRLRLSGLPVELQRAARKARAAFFAAAAASFLVNLLMLVGPIFMLQTYDRVLPSRSLSTLIGLLTIALMLLLLQAAVDATRSRLLERMGHAFDESIRDSIFDSVHHAAIARPNADGLQIIRDLDTVRGFISGNGLVAICDLPWTPLYILVCAIFHPLMGLVVMLGAVGLALVTFVAELLTREPTRALVGLASARRTMSETAFHHAEVVHALGMKRRMSELWSERSQALLDAQRRTADLTGAFGSISRCLRMTLQSGVLAVGAWLVINQQATAGVMLAATILSIRALAPIELAIANWRGFIAARASFERLRENFTTMPAKTDPTTLPAPSRELRVTSVSLTAPRSENLVLHEVSFALSAGSAVAIVGPSGSGKTTLARALVGVGTPRRGVIRIDGAALAQWNPIALGRSTGYLPQDVALFRGTVAQNISRFSSLRHPERLMRAATQAGVHELILRLPQGYETEVGDGGLMCRAASASASRWRARSMATVPARARRAQFQSRQRRRARAGRSDRRSARTRRHRRGHRAPAHLARRRRPLLVLNEGRMQAFGPTESVLPLLAPKQAAAVESAPEGRGSGR